MCLVLTLELYREIEHWFQEEPAVGADLIGGHGFVLGAEHGVEDAGITGSAAPVARASWPASRAMALAESTAPPDRIRNERRPVNRRNDGYSKSVM